MGARERCSDMMKSKGLRTVSAPGFEARVSVWYTDQPDMFAKFKAKGSRSPRACRS